MNENDQELINMQNERAILRERFLGMLKWLKNKPIKFEMYEGATVKGNLRSVDYDILNIHVNNLETPIGLVSEALLRTNDIVCFHFNIK
jgi:hypothetical protein